MNQPDAVSPTQSIPVFRSDDFCAVSGANEGDGLSFARDLMHDDVYMLKTDSISKLLAVQRRQDGVHLIACTTEVGAKGAEVHLDCAVAMMDGSSAVTEVLVLVEIDAKAHASEVYLLPLAPLKPKTEYRLVGIDVEGAARKMAQVACVSFTRGTQITLGSGQQRAIEDLRQGDPVLTRDDGVQRIRWIGQSTQRAHGTFAPIRIAAGTLNNADDLVVSPDHRLFVYQRTDRLGAGRSELLVKARHLVNGTTVTVQTGGFVDYFQLLFDSHQIIYAEGIAAESMLIDDRTAPLLDTDALKDLVAGPKVHRELSGLDVKKALLTRPNAVDLLRQASKG